TGTLCDLDVGHLLLPNRTRIFEGGPRDSGAPGLSRSARASDADFAQLALQASRQLVEALVDRDLLRVHLLQHGRPVGGELGEELLRREVDARLADRLLELVQVAGVALFQAGLELGDLAHGVTDRVDPAGDDAAEGGVLRARRPLHGAPEQLPRIV